MIVRHVSQGWVVVDDPTSVVGDRHAIYRGLDWAPCINLCHDRVKIMAVCSVLGNGCIRKAVNLEELVP